MNYPCGQCEYQATRKESLDQHKISIHEEIKYHCVQCGHQVTSMCNLTIVINMNIKQQQEEV